MFAYEKDAYLAGNCCPRETSDESASHAVFDGDTTDTAGDVDTAPRDDSNETKDGEADPCRCLVGLGNERRGAGLEV